MNPSSLTLTLMCTFWNASTFAGNLRFSVTVEFLGLYCGRCIFISLPCPFETSSLEKNLVNTLSFHCTRNCNMYNVFDGDFFKCWQNLVFVFCCSLNAIRAFNDYILLSGKTCTADAFHRHQISRTCALYVTVKYIPSLPILVSNIKKTVYIFF